MICFVSGGFVIFMKYVRFANLATFVACISPMLTLASLCVVLAMRMANESAQFPMDKVHCVAAPIRFCSAFQRLLLPAESHCQMHVASLWERGFGRSTDDIQYTIYHCTPTGQCNCLRLLYFLSCMCKLFFSSSLINQDAHILSYSASGTPEAPPHCDVSVFISNTKLSGLLLACLVK